MSSQHVFAKDFYVGEISPTTVLTDLKKFKRHQDDVTYNESQLTPLQQINDKIDIKVYFAEWCHDSQREVPRLIRLFSQLNNPNFDVWYYALDTKKSDPLGLAAQDNIKKTPTILVYKDGNEVARILEFPQVDWATDLAEILKRD